MPNDHSPNPPAASGPRRQVVLTTEAIGASVAKRVPVLLDVKYRIYRAWTRGVRPVALRTMFGTKTEPLSTADINSILVEVCRLEMQARREAERAAA